MGVFSGDLKTGAHRCVPDDLMACYVHTMGGGARVRTYPVIFRLPKSAET